MITSEGGSHSVCGWLHVCVGYGLDLENELKMLRVLHQSAHPIDIVSNYCGAHSVPAGQTAAQAADDIIQNQIPALLVLIDPSARVSMLRQYDGLD